MSPLGPSLDAGFRKAETGVRTRHHPNQLTPDPDSTTARRTLAEVRVSTPASLTSLRCRSGTMYSDHLAISVVRMLLDPRRDDPLEIQTSALYNERTFCDGCRALQMRTYEFADFLGEGGNEVFRL